MHNFAFDMFQYYYYHTTYHNLGELTHSGLRVWKHFSKTWTQKVTQGKFKIFVFLPKQLPKW